MKASICSFCRLKLTTAAGTGQAKRSVPGFRLRRGTGIWARYKAAMKSNLREFDKGRQEPKDGRRIKLSIDEIQRGCLERSRAVASSITKDDFYQLLDSGTGFVTREQVVEALMPRWGDTPQRLLKRVVSWSAQNIDVVTLPRRGFAFAPRMIEGCVLLQPLGPTRQRTEIRWVPELAEMLELVARERVDQPAPQQLVLETPDGPTFSLVGQSRENLPPDLIRWVRKTGPGYDAVEVRCVDRKAGRFSVIPTMVNEPAREQADAAERAMLVDLLSARNQRDWTPFNLFLGLLVRGAFRETPARPLFYNLFNPSPLVRVAGRTVPIRGLSDSLVAWAMANDPNWAIDAYTYSKYTVGFALPTASYTRSKPFDGVYRLKVKLKFDDFTMTLDAPATMSLYRLHTEILNAVDFDDDHLWIFYLGHSRASSIEIGETEGAFPANVTLGDLALEKGQKLQFIFDFGDWWEFLIEVKDRRAGETMKTAQVVKQLGKPPRQYPSFEDEDPWE